MMPLGFKKYLLFLFSKSVESCHSYSLRVWLFHKWQFLVCRISWIFFAFVYMLPLWNEFEKKNILNENQITHILFFEVGVVGEQYG